MQGRDVARGSLIFRARETKDPFSMGARLCRPDFWKIFQLELKNNKVISRCVGKELFLG